MQRKTLEKRLVLKKSVRNFISRVLITIILFLTGLIFIKQYPNLKTIIRENIYEKSFKFTKTKKLYQKYFGNILSLENITPEEQPVFDEKLNYSKKTAYKDGVELIVSNNYMVPVLESGIVIYIGEKKDYGSTIVLEQVDGIDVSYSNINISSLKLYDYVEKGKLLGEAKDNKIYLTFQKNGEYLDYQKYL